MGNYNNILKKSGKEREVPDSEVLVNTTLQAHSGHNIEKRSLKVRQIRYGERKTADKHETKPFLLPEESQKFVKRIPHSVKVDSIYNTLIRFFMGSFSHNRIIIPYSSLMLIVR